LQNQFQAAITGKRLAERVPV